VYSSSGNSPRFLFSLGVLTFFPFFLCSFLISGIGYRDGQTVADGNKKYSFGMAGNIFGDMNVAGGYLGVAHYLNTGSVDISTNTNEVYVANAEKSGRVDRSSDGGSKWGAPSGPHTVCISKVQTDGTCGPDRAFKPSEYKFSIFGHVSGKNFSTNVVPGKNGFPVGLSHVAVRMKLKAVGFKASDLQVNKRPYDAAKISEDVTSFSFSHKKGSLAYEFPTEYNVGTVAGAKTDGTLMDVSATKTVKIKVHSPKSADQSILVDYLFETSGLIEGSYFIYDPTVSTYAAAMDDGEKSGATSARTSGAAATMLLGMLSSLVAAMLAYHH
jgi:hypothetical protein